MAILPALQSAAIRLVGRKPGTFYGSPNAFELEISDLANEVAADAARYQDWQALIRFATITADGVTADFALPADYGRQLIASDMASVSGWSGSFDRITDPNAFRYGQARDYAPFPGGWTLYGDMLRFAPPPTQDLTFPYITANYARALDGTPKPAFDADTDVFSLPERLLTLGLVWRWRENKKLDASGDQEAFVKALDEYAASDKGSRVIRKSARRHIPGTYPAWPGVLGGSGSGTVPDLDGIFNAELDF